MKNYFVLHFIKHALLWFPATLTHSLTHLTTDTKNSSDVIKRFVWKRLDYIIQQMERKKKSINIHLKESIERNESLSKRQAQRQNNWKINTAIKFFILPMNNEMAPQEEQVTDSETASAESLSVVSLIRSRPSPSSITASDNTHKMHCVINTEPKMTIRFTFTDSFLHD